MKQPLISGFMIVKNAASQGYPFIEAIRSALPICDEFLVSDGESKDGTWRALEILRGRHPNQIKLFRDPWPGNLNREGVLATMTNVLRVRCSGRYLFNLQANEVLHESSADDIQRLTERWPAAPLFRLPFHNLLGDHLLWMTDYRRRLAVNRPDIVSVADAFDLGADRSPASRLRRFLHRESTTARNVWLSEPVYRYRVLFPSDYVRRLESMSDRSCLLNRELDFARDLHAQMDPARDDPSEFWRRMRAYFDHGMFDGLPPGVTVEPSIPRRCAGELAGAPAIMRPLLGRWSYPLEESLARIL